MSAIAECILLSDYATNSINRTTRVKYTQAKCAYNLCRNYISVLKFIYGYFTMMFYVKLTANSNRLKLTIVGSYSREIAACAFVMSCFFVGSRYITSVGSLIFRISHQNTFTHLSSNYHNENKEHSESTNSAKAKMSTESDPGF